MTTSRVFPKRNSWQSLSEYDGLIVRSGTKVTAVFLRRLNLKVVGRAGMGVDNIDIPAATQRGVVVMNTPGANSVATAELAMGLMLATSRNILRPMLPSVPVNGGGANLPASSCWVKPWVSSGLGESAVWLPNSRKSIRHGNIGV
ncbi:MAG: hypothetical protein R3C44_08565 [Chloroflexota bacterium]